MPIRKEDGYRLIQAGISYTTLTNDAINIIKNPVAMAIWVHLCSKPKDWVVRRSELMERFSIGRDKYQEAMRELRILGLVWDYQIRLPDGNFSDRGVFCCNALGMDGLKTRSTNGEPDLPEDGKIELPLIRPLSNKRLPTKKRLTTKEVSTVIVENWWPSKSVTQDLVMNHLYDQEWIENQVPSFVAYWLDRGEERTSWNSLFIQHCESRAKLRAINSY